MRGALLLHPYPHSPRYLVCLLLSLLLLFKGCVCDAAGASERVSVAEDGPTEPEPAQLDVCVVGAGPGGLQVGSMLSSWSRNMSYVLASPKPCSTTGRIKCFTLD